jgi:hypothetical protein
VKKLDGSPSFQAASLDVPSAFSFCARCAGVEDSPFSLKQSPCPHCGCVGSLNRHSHALGNDPTQAGGQCTRGQRVYCSNRGQRSGCGRTFSIFLAEVLPRHTLTASLVWQWLIKLLAGLSLKAAVEILRLPFALETIYRLRGKLNQRLGNLRPRLCRRQLPPGSRQADPLLQTVEHLQAVFPGSQCPPADFQLQFQHPFLG